MSTRSSSPFGREMRGGEILNISNEEDGTEERVMCVFEGRGVVGSRSRLIALPFSPSFSHVSSTGHHLSTGLSRGST